MSGSVEGSRPSSPPRTPSTAEPAPSALWGRSDQRLYRWGRYRGGGRGGKGGPTVGNWVGVGDAAGAGFGGSGTIVAVAAVAGAMDPGAGGVYVHPPG